MDHWYLENECVIHMRKSMGLILIVGIVVVAVLYTQGSFSSVIAPEEISVVAGWNTVTVPNSWPDTMASVIINSNPIVSAVAFYDGSHWTSNIRPMPTLNDFAVTSGMEISIWASEAGTVNAPGA